MPCARHDRPEAPEHDQLIPSADIVDIPRAGGLPRALLDLNNAFAQELSFLTPEKAAHLVAMARVAARIGDADALLLAFDQDAAYDNPNFAWFKARYPRFVYVDRIVVAPAARGRGLAKALYLDLFRRARGHERVVCEVNADPPNPASDAFHAALGFEAVGGAQLLNTDRPASGKPTSGKPTSGKRVRYFSRALALE